MTRILKYLLLFFLLLLSLENIAQIPPGYYDAAAGLKEDSLKKALHIIIRNHTVISYSGLLNSFRTTDDRPDGKVWDIYSDIPGRTPPYLYSFSDNCGNYNSEGDCYNREHSFPASWFNDASPMYSDLFQVYPTDGYVNNRRSNYPLGNVSTASWTSLNGSKVGVCSDSGYSGTVFEPIDSFKGDLARTCFYMAVRYLGEDASWPGSPMVDGAEPEDWALKVLLAWNRLDPVGQKEIDRNNTIYGLQHNRNPFIDMPAWVDKIWDYHPPVATSELKDQHFFIFPNPAGNILHVRSENSIISMVEIYSMYGKQVYTATSKTNTLSINTSQIPDGIYIISVTTTGSIYCRTLVIHH